MFWSHDGALVKTALPKVSTRGYTFKNDGPQLLLLHGYTGTPYDLKTIAHYFNDQGFFCHAPLLTGHGKTPKHLEGVLFKDWFKTAEKSLLSLDQNKPIFVVGLSMGALLAIELAKKYSKLRALILLAPSLKLNFSAELIISGTHFGLVDQKSAIKKLSGGSDIADPEAKKKCPSLKEMPIFGLMQFEALRQLAKKSVREISLPIFAGFGAKDSAIDVVGSKNHLLNAPSKNLRIKDYLNSKHILPLDYDRDQLMIDIEQFINENL